MKKPIYTKAKLCKASKGWYVYFRYDGKIFRYKFGINYIKNLRDRETEFNSLAKALNQKLSEGWNPTIPDVVPFGSEMTIINAIDFALEKKKPLIAAKSYLGYRNSCSFVKEAIKTLQLDNLLIVNTKRIHIKSILEKVKEQRNASNKAYNKYLHHLSAVLSELIQWDILQFNPANKIKELPVGESKANIPPTIYQQKMIKEHLIKKEPYFYNYIASLFHTGIRPAELLEIKLSMINLDQRLIVLPQEITKTNRERYVPINNHLYNMLVELDVNLLPKNFYLFGSFRESGKGNIGCKSDFIPGPTKIKRDTATRRWEKLVKIELGFKDITMYSEKHAGANAKILAGIPLDALQDLYGHTSKLTTEIYATAVKGQRRQMIIDQSPDF